MERISSAFVGRCEKTMSQQVVMDGRNIYDKKKWKNRVLFTIVSANNTLYHRILTNLITELKS